MFFSMKLTNTNYSAQLRKRRERLLLTVCSTLLSLLLLGAAQAQAGIQPDLLVRLASEGDASYLGGGIFESTATLQSKSQASFPGSAASFRVLLRNAGDQPDSFLVRGTGSLNGATVRFLDGDGVDRGAALASGFTTVTLLPGESLAYLVQVTPVVFQLGASFRVVVEADSAADPSKIDQVKTETIACGSTAALVLSAPPDGSGAPGSVVNYPYTLTNVGNASNSFTLSAASTTGWPGALYADDGAGGGIAGDGVRQAGETSSGASTGVLAPGESYRFFLAVTVPPGSADGAHDDARVSAVGAGASGSDQVTTSAVAAALSVAESVRNISRGGAFASATDALPGDTLEYRMAVSNAGSAPAAPVTVTSALPASTASVPGSFWVGTSEGGDGGACPAAQCGWVRETGAGIVAHLGAGATEAAGGNLPPGMTLYLYFRVLVQ